MKGFLGFWTFVVKSLTLVRIQTFLVRQGLDETLHILSPL